MKKICLISTGRHKGFLLNEVLLGMVIVSIVILLFGRNVVTIFTGWQRMQTDGELLDAGRYMLNKIERHLSLESASITITDHTTIDCLTEYQDKTTKLYIHSTNGGLYMQTKTLAGIGVNPLFIRDCNVSNWQAERISDKKILISFTLTKNNRSKDFVRLFYCVNGVVKNAT